MGGADGALTLVAGSGGGSGDDSAHCVVAHGQMPLGSAVDCLCWHPSGAVLLAASAKGEVCVVDSALQPLVALSSARLPTCTTMPEEGEESVVGSLSSRVVAASDEGGEIAVVAAAGREVGGWEGAKASKLQSSVAPKAPSC